jgi:hypothetical protein
MGLLLDAIQFHGWSQRAAPRRFSFDQFIGNLEIKVDGQTAISDFRFASLSLTKRYDFMRGR